MELWGLLGWGLKDAPKEDGQEESSAVGELHRGLGRTGMELQNCAPPAASVLPPAHPQPLQIPQELFKVPLLGGDFQECPNPSPCAPFQVADT